MTFDEKIKTPQVLEQTVEWTDEHNAIVTTIVDEPYLDKNTGDRKPGCRVEKTVIETLSLKSLEEAAEENLEVLQQLRRGIKTAEEDYKKNAVKLNARQKVLKKDLDIIRQVMNHEKKLSEIEKKKKNYSEALALSKRHTKLVEERNRQHPGSEMSAEKEKLFEKQE